MKIMLLVGFGSFLGGVLRYLISIAFASRFAGFPYGTLVVNLLGCFAIGAVYAVTSKWDAAPEWRLFLATGILGGFTTFSAFSIETVTMIRDGSLINAGIYVVCNIVLGLCFTFLGWYFWE